MPNVLIGRQPIFDRKLNVIGYELLYRDGEQNRAVITDGRLATSLVLSRAFMEIGVDNLVGDKLAFVNLPREFLVNEFDFPIAEKQLVLEVLEDIPMDEEVLGAIRNLQRRGFQIALDDVVSLDDFTEALPYVDILKFELMNVNRDQLVAQVERAKQFPIKLLAEKVETQEEFDWCKDLGFDYFQGYFLCKPVIVSERRLTTSAVAIVHILAEINMPDVQIESLESLVLRDVTLSYKILRLINSAAFGMKSEIRTLKQALSILGLRKLRSLLSIMLLDHTDNKPIELMAIAAVRGKMCEEILHMTGANDSPQGFTVGFFSVLDALLDMPLGSIVNEIPLANEIKEALAHRTGKLGALLKSVMEYEQGNWSEVGFCGLSPEKVLECYGSALAASKEMMNLYGKIE